MNTSIVKSLVIALAAGLTLGLTACDEPETAEAPVETEEAQGELPEVDDDAGDNTAQLDAPDQPEGAPEMGDAPDMGDQPDQPPGQPPAMGEAPEVDLDDEDIDQFVAAVEAINEHHEENDVDAQMADAAPEDQQEIMQEVMAEAQQLVEAEGLSFEEFMTISQQAQHDPELQQELAERLDIDPMGAPPAP